MKIENGIYYTDEELTITNIYDVVKNGYEEALSLALDGVVKGFAAVGFEKKYGWNGSMYYELINLDYQDLSEFNPPKTEAAAEETPDPVDDTAETVDIEAIRAENETLKEEIEKLRPFADKYTTYADVIELIEKMKDTSEERFVNEIERFKQIFSEIANDAKAILEKVDN